MVHSCSFCNEAYGSWMVWIVSILVSRSRSFVEPIFSPTNPTQLEFPSQHHTGLISRRRPRSQQNSERSWEHGRSSASSLLFTSLNFSSLSSSTSHVFSEFSSLSRRRQGTDGSPCVWRQNHNLRLMDPVLYAANASTSHVNTRLVLEAKLGVLPWANTYYSHFRSFSIFYQLYWTLIFISLISALSNSDSFRETWWNRCYEFAKRLRFGLAYPCIKKIIDLGTHLQKW